jgi:acetyl-CoA carboxylase carboxyltransferase component
MYEAGQAMEAASFLEIDAVIDPSKTRETIIKAQHSPK